MNVSTRAVCLTALVVPFLVPVRLSARCRSVVIRVTGALTSPLGARELLLRASPEPRGKSRTTISVDGARFSAELQANVGKDSDVGADCSGVPQNVTVTLASGERQTEHAVLSFPKDFQNTRGIWLARSALRVNPEGELPIE